ncbi:MAG TPA: hypothetical protein VGK25_04965 [Ignavibacteria bacterium]
MRISAKKDSTKRSKGYRLKISTHRLIDRMQEILQCSQDQVITTACRKFYNDIISNKKVK